MRVLFLPGPTPAVDDIRAALQASHPGSEVEVCAPETAPDTLQARSDYDAVVVDGSALPPDAQCMAALRAQRPQVPVAVLVAPGDVPGEARALLAGADTTVPHSPTTLERIGSLLMRIRRRDADPERRDWRLWFAGRDTELRRAVAARLGRRVLLMSLSREGKLVPMLEDPAGATALVVDARDNGDDMLAGLQRVRELHPALATIVIADAAYHAAFLRIGADDCLPPGTDVERLLLAVDRLSSHRQLASEVVALRARENRLRAVVEYLPEAVVLVAATRSVLAVNLTGLELLGAAEARHVIGRELTPWLTPADDEDLAQFVDSVSSGTTRELNALTRHAQPQRVLLRAVPFQREPGKPAAVLITLRPVPEPVTAEPAAVEGGQPELAVATAATDAEMHAVRARVEELEALRARHEALEAQAAQQAHARAESEQQLREVIATLEHELDAERERSARLAESLASREAEAAWSALTPPSVAALEQALADERTHVTHVTSALDEHRARVDELAATLAEQRSAREAAEATTSSLQASLDETRTALEDTRVALDETRSALDQARTALAHSEAAERDRATQVEELERGLADARQMVERLLADGAATAEGAAAQAQRLATLEQELAESRTVLAAAQEQVQAVEARADAAAAGEADATRRAAHLEQELADARAALTSAHEQLQAAQGHADAARATEAETAHRAAELEQALATLQGDLERERADIARLESERARLADEAGTLERALDEARDQLAGHRAAYETALQQLGERDAVQAAQAGHLREVEREFADSLAALATAREQLQDRERLVETLQAAEATSVERAAELQQTLDGLREERDGLREEREGLREELERLRRELERERAEHLRRDEEAQAVERAMTDARSAFESAQAEVAALEARAARAEEALAVQQAAIASMEEALATREAELERTRLEDEGLRSALSRLEREGGARIRALEQERDALRRDAREWHAIQQELPTLRDAQRQMVAMAGQLEESQLVRAQALALESEVAELRHAREHAARLEAELSEVRTELASRPSTPARLEAVVDEETRWLLYDVASIGHLTTTPDARILGANDIAAQLLGHFSRDTLQASGRLPEPLLLAAGAFAHRPTRFEVCLQHGDDGPLHWIVGLATPHAGVPATVTWMLIDVSEQRLHARRSRFLRRMEAMTHVLSAATAESATLVERATPLLQAAAASLEPDSGLDIEGAQAALTRTQALLAQLSGFARKRARRVGVRDVRALLDAAGPVLVHVAGEDVVCTIAPSEEPLHAALEDAEFEQFMTSLVMAGRDALPLGGRLTVSTRGVNADTRDDTTFFTRPSVEVRMHAEGYGAQMPDTIAALHDAAARLGGTFAAESDDIGDLRIVIRLARVFVTS